MKCGSEVSGEVARLFSLFLSIALMVNRWIARPGRRRAAVCFGRSTGAAAGQTRAHLVAM